MDHKFPLVILELTEVCNLACTYCYEQNRVSKNPVMSSLLARSAVTQLLCEKGRVGFYGGEPLLNFDTLFSVVSFLQGQGISFSLTTNGSLLTKEIADFLALHNFSVILSLDGPASIHDSRRRTCTGKDSFAAVFQGLSLLKLSGVKHVVLRSTFCPGDTDLLERVTYLNSLCDLGYADGVSIEPTCLCSSSCSTKSEEWTEASIQKLDFQFEDIVLWAAARKKQGLPVRFHSLTLFSDRLKDDAFHFSECGAGSGMVLVSTSGDLYACHRKGDTRIGSLVPGVDKEQQRKWLLHSITSCSDCLQCKLFGVCGGICKEQSLQRHGNLLHADAIGCAFRKLWIKHALTYVRKTDEAFSGTH